jgi:branched-chain amino acid transport system ATP-binding protein
LSALLEIEDVEAGYGRAQVLFGMALTVGEREAVTLMGRNGMGKTTTVRAIMGQIPPIGGRIRFAGERIDGLAAHRIARAGLGLVPEGRHIFPNLTVRENLQMARANRRGERDPWTFERVLDFFPRLAERLDNGGRQLSGGEQQMLAIGRALMTNPRLLILDEATEGLAPIVRKEIWARLGDLRAAGLALIVIDKEADSVAGLADRHYIVEKGRIAWSGEPAALAANPALRESFLGV